MKINVVYVSHQNQINIYFAFTATTVYTYVMFLKANSLAPKCNQCNSTRGSRTAVCLFTYETYKLITNNKSVRQYNGMHYAKRFMCD